jgi:hypothetical protein
MRLRIFKVSPFDAYREGLDDKLTVGFTGVVCNE